MPNVSDLLSLYPISQLVMFDITNCAIGNLVTANSAIGAIPLLGLTDPFIASCYRQVQDASYRLGLDYHNFFNHTRKQHQGYVTTLQLFHPSFFHLAPSAASTTRSSVSATLLAYLYRRHQNDVPASLHRHRLGNNNLRNHRQRSGKLQQHQSQH
eukprot:scaffold5046_cov76-Skeletonema_menzelii.AAC.1